MMPEPCLLREVEAFLRDFGMPPTTFGREVLRDPRFVFQLRDGRAPTERTSRRVRTYMESARRAALKGGAR